MEGLDPAVVGAVATAVTAALGGLVEFSRRQARSSAGKINLNNLRIAIWTKGIMEKQAEQSNRLRDLHLLRHQGDLPLAGDKVVVPPLPDFLFINGEGKALEE